MKTNEDRGRGALNVAHVCSPGDADTTALINLVANIRHACDVIGVSWLSITAGASRHYAAEIEEELKFDHDDALLGALDQYEGLDVEHWTQLGGGCHAVAIILRREGAPETYCNRETGKLSATRYLMVTWDGEWVVCFYSLDRNGENPDVPEFEDGVRLSTAGIGEREVDALALRIAAFARALS